jgi:hypothetical protein
VTASPDDTYLEVFSGRAAMDIQGQWYDGTIIQNEQDINNYGTFAFPSGGTNRLSAFAEMTQFNADITAEKLDACMKFMDYYYDPDVAAQYSEYYNMPLPIIGATMPEGQLNVPVMLAAANDNGTFTITDQAFPTEVADALFNVQDGIANGQITPADGAAQIQRPSKPTRTNNLAVRRNSKPKPGRQMPARFQQEASYAHPEEKQHRLPVSDSGGRHLPFRHRSARSVFAHDQPVQMERHRSDGVHRPAKLHQPVRERSDLHPGDEEQPDLDRPVPGDHDDGFPGLRRRFEQAVRRAHVFPRFFYFPAVIAPIAVAIIWRWMYNPSVGFVNELSRALNLGLSKAGSPALNTVFTRSFLLPCGSPRVNP